MSLSKEARRRVYAANAERERERSRQWRANNAEREREQKRRYREANRERIKEAGRRWREVNKERQKEAYRRWVKAHPERARELQRRWREANPERKQAYAQLRRVRELGNGVDLTVADEEWLRKFTTHCRKCGVRMTEKAGSRQKQVDHIVTVVTGGRHTLTNVRVICRDCNLHRPKDGSDEVQLILFARLGGVA